VEAELVIVEEVAVLQRMIRKLTHSYKKLKIRLLFRLNLVSRPPVIYMMSFSIVPFLNLDPAILLDIQTPTSLQKMLIGLIGIFVLELWSFLSIVGYLITLYVIKYTEIEQKYPKLKRIINYYKKTNLFFIFFEVLLFILFNIIIIILFGHLLYLTIN
jgi:hypothetical protein